MEWNIETLTKLRKGQGLSQKDVAEALGVSRDVIANWEMGRSRFPERMFKYLTLLGLEVHEAREMDELKRALEFEVWRKLGRNCEVEIKIKVK